MHHLETEIIFHGMSITLRATDFMEDFIFGGPKENEQIIDLFINHYYIIERFIFYLKQINEILDLNNNKILPISPFYKEMLSSQTNKYLLKSTVLPFEEKNKFL